MNKIQNSAQVQSKHTFIHVYVNILSTKRDELGHTTVSVPRPGVPSLAPVLSAVPPVGGVGGQSAAHAFVLPTEPDRVNVCVVCHAMPRRAVPSSLKWSDARSRLLDDRQALIHPAGSLPPHPLMENPWMGNGKPVCRKAAGSDDPPPLPPIPPRSARPPLSSWS